MDSDVACSGVLQEERRWPWPMAPGKGAAPHPGAARRAVPQMKPLRPSASGGRSDAERPRWGESPPPSFSTSLALTFPQCPCTPLPGEDSLCSSKFCVRVQTRRVSTFPCSFHSMLINNVHVVYCPRFLLSPQDSSNIVGCRQPFLHTARCPSNPRGAAAPLSSELKLSRR